MYDPPVLRLRNPLQNKRLRRSSLRSLRLTLTISLTCLLATSAFGSGFLIPEQGAKASSMAGAFAATADDPSAMFFNVAGIAQIRRTTLSGGMDFITFK